MSILNNIKTLLNQNLMNNVDNKVTSKNKSKSTDITKKIDSSKINSRDIFTNSITSTKIVNNLLESCNIVVQNKLFCGFSENDSENIKKLNAFDNSTFFSKNNAFFLNNITVGKNLISKNDVFFHSKLFIGYSNSKNLNEDTSLHVKGDTEINGNTYVYEDLVVEKDLNVSKKLNIGYEYINPLNTSSLNVNGDAFIDGAIYNVKSIKTKSSLQVDESLVVNNISYLNNINTNTNISVDKIILNDIVIKDSKISKSNSKIIINNVLNSFKKLFNNIDNLNNSTKKDNNIILQNMSVNSNIKGILFTSNNTNKLNVGQGVTTVNAIISVSNNTILHAFLMVNFVYSKALIVNVNYIKNTLTLIDSESNLVNIFNDTEMKNKESNNIDPISNVNNNINNNINNKSTTKDLPVSDDENSVDSDFIKKNLLSNSKSIVNKELSSDSDSSSSSSSSSPSSSSSSDSDKKKNLKNKKTKNKK